MDLPIEYLIIIVGIVIGIIFQKGNKFIFLYPLLLYMAFIAISRGEDVGTDYSNYIDNFHQLNYRNLLSMAVITRSELGFLTSICIFKEITDNHFLFFGLAYLIYFAGFWYYCRFMKADNILAIFVFFFFGFYLRSFNTLRQFMVIGMILFFIPYLYKGKYLKFALSVLILSLLFHTTELLYILLIPLMFCSKKKLPYERVLLSLTVLASYMLFYIDHSFLYNITFGIGDYNQYFANGENREEIGNLTATIFSLLALIIVFCANLNKYRFEVYSITLSFVIFNIMSLVMINGTRLFLDFNIFNCALFPLMLRDKTTRFRSAYSVFMIAACLGLFVNQTILNNMGDVKPYYFCF